MDSIFEKFIKTKEINFKYAKGMRDIIGREFHQYNEIFLFVDGKADFITKDFRITLSPNTLVVIPKKCFHQFSVHCNESEYIRCVLNFDLVDNLNDLISNITKEVLVFSSTDIDVKRYFTKLIKTVECSYSDEDKKTMLYALFSQVLLEIKYTKHIPFSPENNINPIVSQAITYIDRNISAKLDVASIAKQISYSPSYLSHIFKSDLNISIYNYLLQKKLILANQKLVAGIPAQQVALECGFDDYSGFYKIYKKYFGKPPSKSKKK